MPLSQVQRGMNCTGYTVVHGTTISSFAVHVQGVVTQPGEGARILVSVSGPVVAASGVAAGFSGSPVYCPGPQGQENIGAISEGIGQYGNNVVLVTPIQDMLGEPVRPPYGTPKLEAKTRALVGPLTVSGLSPNLMSILKRAAHRAGRLVVPAAAGPAPDVGPTPLVPGASVGVSYSTGVIGIGAIGTVTYRRANTVYLFGHPLDSAGRRSLFLENAYVFGVISDPDPLFGSYKLAAPGRTLGTVTSDTPNAVVGVVGAPPNQIPVTVRAQDLNTGKAIVERTHVADESDVGFPLGGSLLDLVAPFAAGQAAIDVYDGSPAIESGTMCLHVVLQRPASLLHFCDRYVGIGAAGESGYGAPEVANGAMTDVGNALSLVDSVQFATPHVKSVRIIIKASRGLAEATILSVHAPSRVKPGQTVTARLKLQRFRSGVKTIQVRLHIPRNAHGRVPVAISGPFAQLSGGLSGASGLTALFTSLFTGEGEFPPQPPTTLSQLRSQFAHVPPYDGLEARIGHGKPEHIYRDPKLLIAGNATLHFELPGGGSSKP